MPEESHPGFEIMLIIEGTQESVIDGYTYTVEEGSISSHSSRVQTYESMCIHGRHDLF